MFVLSILFAVLGAAMFKFPKRGRKMLVAQFQEKNPNHLSKLANQVRLHNIQVAKDISQGKDFHLSMAKFKEAKDLLVQMRSKSNAVIFVSFHGDWSGI